MGGRWCFPELMKGLCVGAQRERETKRNERKLERSAAPNPQGFEGRFGFLNLLLLVRALKTR